MNHKQALKNQDLFTFKFFDEEVSNPFQFKLNIKSDFREDIKKDIDETPDIALDPEVYGDYLLSMEVGKWFFYGAFIHVMPYQKRIDFLNWQIEQCKEKLSFLYRVESLSQCDYWYRFGEHSYYNQDTEKVVLDWVVDRYCGKNVPKSPLILLK